jgi:exodeoxyribonuclease VIII
MSGVQSDYREQPGAHYSTLKELGRSARHFAWLEAHDREPTAALGVGIATHLAVLEPEKFAERVVIWGRQLGRRSGSIWAKFKGSADRRDQIVLTEDEHDEVLALARAVRSSPQARPLLTDPSGEAEKAIAWVDGETGIQCKARLDWVCGAGIADLKTTRDASPDGFARECARYGYHRQAAFYVDGYTAAQCPRGGLVSATHRQAAFSIIAVEKAPPYVVQVYRVAGDVLELGRAEMRSYLRQLAQLQRLPQDQWPGYADEPLDLYLPRWAMPREDALGDLGLDATGLDDATKED